MRINHPQQVFAGTDWGLYFTDDITAATPVWYRFQVGLPNALMIWSMSIDRGNTTVDNIYGGYFLICFGVKDSPIGKLLSLSVSGARESPDGGSDFHLNYSIRDLPVQLPMGAVNGIQFELSEAGDSLSEFWVTLGNNPDACSATSTVAPTFIATSAPDPGSKEMDRKKSSWMLTVESILAVSVLLALIWFFTRRRHM